MRKLLFGFIIFSLFAFPAGAQENLPLEVGFQGNIGVQGLPFNGTGQFKFAFSDSGGFESFWSNDQSSTSGDEPDSSVSVEVVNGGFVVTLGDIEFENMEEIPEDLFSDVGSELYLKVWFNDGVNGFQLLAPFVKVTSVVTAVNASLLGGMTPEEIMAGTSVGGGSGIEVDDDGNVTLDTTQNQTWTGEQTFSSQMLVTADPSDTSSDNAALLVNAPAPPPGASLLAVQNNDTDVMTVDTDGDMTVSGGATIASTLTLSSLDCTGDANSGALTADASGVVSCSNDDSGGVPGFDTIATGTNTTATMTVGAGGSIVVSGGSVEASNLTASSAVVDDTEVVDNLTIASSKAMSVSVAGTPLIVDRTGSDGALIQFQEGGIDRGFIELSSGAIAYNNFTGGHAAHSDDDFEVAQLVTMNGDNVRSGNGTLAEPIYGVELSRKPNDPAILGSFMSVRDDNLLDSEKDLLTIMAVGNGFMWVVDTGNDLKPGDYLMSAHVPGHAMVDPGTFAKSHIIAKLSDKVNWDEVDETVDYNGELVKHTLVSVLYTTFVVNNRPIAAQ